MTDRTKPEVDFPEGPAPTELLSTDEIVGDGEEAGRGDVVDVHYVGVSTPPASSSTPPGTAASRCASSSAWARSSPAGTRASRA